MAVNYRGKKFYNADTWTVVASLTLMQLTRVTTPETKSIQNFDPF
jgi:hypothetical protein